eukprot:8748532-Lingulodinium_polyedra.AAC.1
MQSDAAWAAEAGDQAALYQITRRLRKTKPPPVGILLDGDGIPPPDSKAERQHLRDFVKDRHAAVD